MISTSAALTSIHALSAEDCAAVTRWSNCASFSLVAEACEAEGELKEEAAAGENCFAGSGTAISAMAKSKQHFHTAFIIYVRSATYEMTPSRPSQISRARFARQVSPRTRYFALSHRGPARGARCVGRNYTRRGRKSTC